MYIVECWPSVLKVFWFLGDTGISPRGQPPRLATDDTLEPGGQSAAPMDGLKPQASTGMRSPLLAAAMLTIAPGSRRWTLCPPPLWETVLECRVVTRPDVRVLV
jgi:hypothetical protein